MPAHIILQPNSVGRDFVIGDLHGEFEQLISSLQLVSFDPVVDRLFSTGDLIDRGPMSLECILLIYEPWFFMVRGNHEQLMLDSLAHNDEQSINCWMQNGGSWINNEIRNNSALLLDICNKINKLPFLMTIQDTCHIVHAELTKRDNNNIIPVTNKHIDEWEFTDNEMSCMIWGRNVYQYHRENKQYITSKIKFHSDNLLPIYCGHTYPANYRPIQLQKQIFIDTGIQQQQFLTITNIQTNTLYQKPFHSNELIQLQSMDIIQ